MEKIISKVSYFNNFFLFKNEEQSYAYLIFFIPYILAFLIIFIPIPVAIIFDNFKVILAEY